MNKNVIEKYEELIRSKAEKVERMWSELGGKHRSERQNYEDARPQSSRSEGSIPSLIREQLGFDPLSTTE